MKISIVLWNIPEAMNSLWDPRAPQEKVSKKPWIKDALKKTGSWILKIHKG